MRGGNTKISDDEEALRAPVEAVNVDVGDAWMMKNDDYQSNAGKKDFGSDSSSSSSNRRRSRYTNLSYANIATTSPAAFRAQQAWAEDLAHRGGAAFSGEREATAMMPLREAAAELMNASVEQVFVGSSASELLGTVAWAIATSSTDDASLYERYFASTKGREECDANASADARDRELRNGRSRKLDGTDVTMTNGVGHQSTKQPTPTRRSSKSGAYHFVPRNCNPPPNFVSTRSAFPTTVYPFARVAAHCGAEVRLADYDDDPQSDTFMYTDPAAILALIDDHTRLVVLSHVEYSNGQRYDMSTFARAAHAVGALLIVDATQSLGMVPIYMDNNDDDNGVDVLVAAGYKWLRGTFGAAVGWVHAGLLQPRSEGGAFDLHPGMVGFRSHHDLWDLKAERYELPSDASRFEFSTLAFGTVLGLAAAVRELNAFVVDDADADVPHDQGGCIGSANGTVAITGIEAVWRYDLRLADRVREGAERLGLTVVSPPSREERSAIVCLKMPCGSTTGAGEVADRLEREHHILVTNRAGLLRVSPHIDNCEEDVDRLFQALAEMLRLEPGPGPGPGQI